MTEVDKTIVEAELRRIRDEHDGNLAPDDVVEEAKARKHPLHNLFEWDDTVAGHQFRLSQARALIRSVRFEVTVEVMPIRVPEYVRNPSKSNKEQGYIPLSLVQRDKEMAADLIEREIERAESAMDRALALANTVELGQLVISRLRQKIEALAREAERKTKEAARGDTRRKRTPTLLPSKRRGDTRPQA